MKDVILYKQQTHTINTLNGVLNETNVEFAKRTMLFDVIRSHTNLVTTKQGYPQNDLSDVEMTIDCVVISRKKYDNLIKLEKKYLKFPKLKE